MTVREFDNATIGAVEYRILDHAHILVASFTRDVLHDPGEYRRNLVTFDKYENARVVHVFNMNGIIRVRAEIE